MSSTITPMATKRRLRRRGPERQRHAEADIAVALAEWDDLHDLAATLPHWSPGDPGRPPLFPPAAILLFGIMRWGWGSERSVERQLDHHGTWEPIRSALHARYPEYKGLQFGAEPMNRHQFRRYRDRYLTDATTFNVFIETFRAHAAELTKAMGMFDPKNVSVTHPDPTTFLAGDATVIRSRFDAAPGERYIDPVTGEIIDKLSDPDALWYPVFDEFGAQKKSKVYGTKFGILHAKLPHDHERVITDIFHITDGADHEAAAVERAVERFQGRAPALTGIVYDMAMRGTNRERLYDLGLHTITKVPKIKGGGIRTRSLGMSEATTKNCGRTEQIEIWAVNGAASIQVMTAGKTAFVALDRVQTRRVKTKSDEPGRRHRWSNDYRVPADPRVPTRLHGAEIRIRLDDRNASTAPYSRAENLHAIAPGESDWDRLFPSRNLTESINWWIKDRHHGREARGPAVGAKKQHVALLCSALYNNFAASIAHQERVRPKAA
jgi:hypothetical protein